VRFSPKIGETLKEIFSQNQENLIEIFSQNRSKFERYFLPKSEKAVTKFSKAGGEYPPPTPPVAPRLKITLNYNENTIFFVRKWISSKTDILMMVLKK
jgi:hypothetical protein